MRLAEIERHAASMEELQRIVGAMRAIASMRMQEAVRALASVREYGSAFAEGVSEALAIAAEEAPVIADGNVGRTDARRAPAGGSGRRAIVLFASEHGFVGGFNQRLVAAIEADSAPGGALLIVGSRGAAVAAERGHDAEWECPLATRLAGIPEVVRLLEERLLPLITRAEVVRVDVIFSRCLRSGELAIERRRLFPLQLTPVSGRRAVRVPLHDLAAPDLLEKLTAGYMLAQLTEAATEALAAENAARFTAMESARDNVARKLDTLRLDASRARQEEVTTELLDLITGERASGISHADLRDDAR